jgi:hypothetical protein
MATTISSRPGPGSGHGQLGRYCQPGARGLVACAANSRMAMIPFDDGIPYKERVEVEEEKPLFRYRASSVQISMVDRNLEFLENAYTNCRIRIKAHGLEAEGVTIQEPDALTWSVTRSPINVWCHGCLQIIGAYMRYGKYSSIPF